MSGGDDRSVKQNPAPDTPTDANSQGKSPARSGSTKTAEAPEPPTSPMKTMVQKPSFVAADRATDPGFPAPADSPPVTAAAADRTEPNGVDKPFRMRRIIAIGGGRGGVGKTLLSVNLAVYLAQLGRNVVICDADPFGSNVHTMLGLGAPPFVVSDDISEGHVQPVNTTVPGLKLLPTFYDRWSLTPKRPSRKTHWLRPIREIDVDYVVLNLGASTTPAALDIFHEADVGIAVAAPEPTAIEATYRFCRAMFARRVRRVLMRDKFKLRVVERALESLSAMPTPREVITEIARFDQTVANLAAGTLGKIRPRLVIGKTRLRRDLDLGPAMISLSERYLGIAMDYLGYVEHDDAVWLTARRRRPLLIDSPTAKSARNVERVARRLLAVLASQQDFAGADAKPVENPASRLNAPLTLYDILGVSRTAGDEEIRRAYKLKRGIFQEESLPIVSLVDEEGMREEQARINEAYDTLLDPARRQAYDMSVFPDDERTEQQPERSRPSATEAELAQLRAELARELTAETEFTGALLKRAREAQGLELQDIAQRTKISLMYLRAVENEDFATLPARVYVGGFLQQIAKTLKLDPTQVRKTYLRRLGSTEEGT